MNLDDFLDHFNWIERLSNLLWLGLSAVPHRNLRGEWCITPGLVEIHIERHDASGAINHTGAEAERLLKRYGIPVHGRRVRHAEFIFSVPAQQAAWAEYVIARSGIQFAASHRFADARNIRWAGRHAGPVPAWVDRKEIL